MLLSQLFDPLLLIEKIGRRAGRIRRRRRLVGTPAAQLSEPYLTSLSLLDLLTAEKRPNVVFDVGAHVGTWTLLAKSVIHDAVVHAFKPLPQHVEDFKRTVAGLEGVHLHQIGLGSSGSTADIIVTDRSDASSFLTLTKNAKITYGLREVQSIGVSLETIDGLLKQGRVSQPDLIKLDVQGYEVEVLKGAIEALARCSWVICEVSFVEYYAGQPLFHHVAKIMEEQWFRVFALSHATPLGTGLTQIDVLFSKQSG